ncbi:hypothetical protein ACFQI3_15730 [Hansschlegelia quercus]|uniref:Lipoprotein n=1 Tax=Hansschlegelia quercus TaxID=2528245 RepID=A0A4Q9GGC7_9HYPH|nr:hypothetical protein [Hansschlegelia quercus]TBN52391.1 hypothetical protein EYR15_11135 [Hansschlegelia quercus]
MCSVRPNRPIAAAAALAALLSIGGCSTVGGAGADADGPRESFATRLLGGGGGAPPAAATPEDMELKRQCPRVDVLEGASSYPVYDQPGTTDPFSLRYQARLADTARECSNLGVEAGIRVGVVGRVILGPKGAPGTFRVPLRIAVVDETDKPVYSESRLVEVTVPAGQGTADFTHVEDNIVVPIPSNRFRGWRILVGYDPVGAKAGAGGQRKR